jgi:dihydroorotase
MSDAPRVAYINARIVDPASHYDGPGELLATDGVIEAVGPNLFDGRIPEDVTVVDCGGNCLAPGLIDMRVFVGEPGQEHKDTFASAGHAAAAGGVTTFVTMPDTDPVVDDIALVQYVARRARETSPVNVLPMGAATKGLKGAEMTEFGMMAEAGAVGFTDGRKSIANARVLMRMLSYATTFGALIVQKPEEPTLAEDGCMNQGEIATRLGLIGIPTIAETVMIERDARLVELTGGRCHMAQVSCRASVDAIRRAKAAGLSISCGASPENFGLNETAIDSYRTFFKTSPPLRSEDDRQAVVEGIADGTIDVIVSNHDPQDQESKRLPFAQAAYGAAGLETLLPIALEMVHNGKIKLVDLLAKMTIEPAKLLKLESGRLAAGAPADLIVFDPEQPWKIDATKLRSKSKNTPFDERPVQGKVLRTVVGGVEVFNGFTGSAS